MQAFILIGENSNRSQFTVYVAKSKQLLGLLGYMLFFFDLHEKVSITVIFSVGQCILSNAVMVRVGPCMLSITVIVRVGPCMLSIAVIVRVGPCMLSIAVMVRVGPCMLSIAVMVRVGPCMFSITVIVRVGPCMLSMCLLLFSIPTQKPWKLAPSWIFSRILAEMYRSA